MRPVEPSVLLMPRFHITWDGKCALKGTMLLGPLLPGAQGARRNGL